MKIIKDQEFYDDIFYYEIALTFFGIIGVILVIALIWG